MPHEFPRCIRDLSSLAYWKSSELKVFMLYTGIAALFTSLETKYFEHYCLYVLIIRQMCDSYLNFNAENSHQLMLIWHQNLQKLYGDYEMTFTAHVHLHLSKQVERFGPLHKISGFVFEGMIKHIKQFITSTRFVGQQVSRRISSERNIKSIAQKIEPSNGIFPIIYNFIGASIVNKDCLSSEKIKFSTEEQALIMKIFPKHNLQSFKVFGRYFNSKRLYTSYNYEICYIRSSSFVGFQEKKKTAYGQILNFIEIDHESYAILKRFRDNLDLYSFLMLSEEFSEILRLNLFDKYFKVFNEREFDLKVIATKHLGEKCIKIGLGDNNFMITPVLAFEHD